jgi:hypothetical protein
VIGDDDEVIFVVAPAAWSLAIIASVSSYTSILIAMPVCFSNCLGISGSM